MKKQYLVTILLQAIYMSHSILIEENGKDLPTNYNFDILSRRRRPSSSGASSGCNFNGVKGGKYKTDGTGRTFFDLQFINVGYNHNYNINCGGGGHPPEGGINKPILGGNKPIIQKPINKPILGGLLQQGGGQHQGGELLGNKPILSMIIANRPLQGLFSQSQSQSDSSQTGVISGAISGIVSLLPGPQDIGQGLGDGISSFLQTIPQIGQSFQSLLPSFENFQFPSLPSLPPLNQGSQSQSISGTIPTAPVTQPPTVAIVTPVAPDPTDPDDTIYNDDIKPVHEDHDPVTDPHFNNKLPPGAYLNRHYEQNRYQATKNYNNQKIYEHVNRNKYHYQQNSGPFVQITPQSRQSGQPYGQYEGQSSHLNEELGQGRGGRGFRFPSS